MTEWKHTACNNCGIGCNLEVQVVDNKIVNVRPGESRLGPNMEYCCRKGRAAKYFQDNPRRLNYPLKKVGDHFERISWEQAISEIGEKFRSIIDKYGPKTFAMVGGALAVDQSDKFIAFDFMKAFGGQYAYGPIGFEFAGNWWSHGRITGHQGLVTEADEPNIKVFVFWGANSYVSHQISNARDTIKTRSEDSEEQIIVVDTRLSETARMADMHIHPVPGVDALMIRGMIALILERGWEDREFLKTWIADWDQAKKWFEGFDYQKAFEVAKVPMEQMEEFCHVLSHNTWGVHQDLGLFCGRHSTLNSYMLYCLMAVTGCLEVKGNRTMDSFKYWNDGEDDRTEGMWRTVETNRFRTAGEYPAGVLSQEMLSDKEDHLRAILCSEVNPARSFPDTKEIIKGLDRMDLVVTIDIVMTETAQHSDYVLPGMTGFENYQWAIFQGSPNAIACMLKHPVIEPIEERRPDGNIILDIARAAGYIPEMSEEVYKAAVLSVKDRDIVPFIRVFDKWMSEHPEWEKSRDILLTDALSRSEAMESANRAQLRKELLYSPIRNKNIFEPIGLFPKAEYIEKLNTEDCEEALLSRMDEAFWRVDDNHVGTLVGLKLMSNEDVAKDIIFHEDKLLHLFDEMVDEQMQSLTPEQELEAISLDAEFPMLMSSGNHGDDGGHNATMRNPASYKYRDPFKLLLNPMDAEKYGIANGEKVRIVTEAGAEEIPVEYSWKTAENYCVYPHHYGMEKRDGKIYGNQWNTITKWDDLDEISGDPIVRYISCRIEKIS